LQRLANLIDRWRGRLVPLFAQILLGFAQTTSE
jgi:hypothetical protein